MCRRNENKEIKQKITENPRTRSVLLQRFLPHRQNCPLKVLLLASVALVTLAHVSFFIAGDKVDSTVEEPHPLDKDFDGTPLDVFVPENVMQVS